MRLFRQVSCSAVHTNRSPDIPVLATLREHEHATKSHLISTKLLQRPLDICITGGQHCSFSEIRPSSRNPPQLLPRRAPPIICLGHLPLLYTQLVEVYGHAGILFRRLEIGILEAGEGEIEQEIMK